MKRSPGFVPDRLLGVLGGVMILAALIVLIRGGAKDASTPAAPPPPIQLIAPTSGATLRGPFLIVFRVENAELSRTSMGWGLPGMHLHIDVDDASVMPAASDIVRQPDGSYRWAFGALGPGAHRIRLYWSDVNHIPLGGGGSPVVRVNGS